MQKIRVALNFELVNDGTSLMSIGRPQDFRVKAARWQYLPMWIFIGNIEYEAHCYARRWAGDGSDLAQLQDAEQPTPGEMNRLLLAYADRNGGFPHNPTMLDFPASWDDPLLEDDILDESDDPEQFKYYDPDQDDDQDAPIVPPPSPPPAPPSEAPKKKGKQ